ncbi:unnamed protein product [Rhodiola kirilowii]
MTGKGSKKPRGWVSCRRTELKAIAADGGYGADAVQAKIQKAQMLLEILNEKFLRVKGYIRYETFQRDHYQLQYLTQKEWSQKEWSEYDSETERMRICINNYWEQALEEKYYEHHGRVIKKHLLIREQDDIIRTSRREMVHQRNSLAGERRLIKDLKLAEETRANIIVGNITINRIMNNDRDDYEADKKRIKDERAWIGERGMPLKGKKTRVEESNKEIEYWEKGLMKLNKLKQQVDNFISFQMIQLNNCALKS